MDAPSFTLAELPALKNQVQLGSVGQSRFLGSQLGVLIKRSAREIGCEVDFKAFGGLRAFVATYLPQFSLVRLRDPKIGGDDEYVLTDSPVTATPISESPRTLTSFALWQAVTNPSSESVAVLTPSYELVVLRAPDVATAVGKLFPKVKHGDYQPWAREFVQSIDAPQRGDAQAVVDTYDGEAFVEHWYAYLNSMPGRQFLREWERHRTEKVAQWFTKQLIEFGCNASQATSLADLLKASRAATKRSIALSRDHAPRASAGSMEYKHVWTFAGTGGPSPEAPIVELRRLIHLAVEQLSLDQLKAIPIPAGVLLELRKEVTAS